MWKNNITNKSFIFIYGKYGSCKTTFSKNDCFDSEFVFNVDYVNKNIKILNKDNCKVVPNENSKQAILCNGCKNELKNEYYKRSKYGMEYC